MPPRMSPSQRASWVPGIGNGGGCGSAGSLPPAATWYPLQCCHGNQDGSERGRGRKSMKEGARGSPKSTGSRAGRYGLRPQPWRRCRPCR